ncbi:HD domain-containing phosphohydrolase [Tuwongella immobilis]|uniref:FHA domain-containing protein n=1 Tax=Tuwongella immobilis TaxID=692036 RepID=A0A6C2YI88_9BACT
MDQQLPHSSRASDLLLRRAIAKPLIRLRGISGDLKGKVWEADGLLRAGRLSTLEIVLDDNSVSRKHAEIAFVADTWCVRDLNSTNGTYINGIRIGSEERVVNARDIVQFGKVAMMVEFPEPSNAPNGPSSDQILVEATTSSSWEDGLERLAFDRNNCPRPNELMLALLRAGHHFVSLESEDALLHSILNDAVSVLDAQRGAIVLAEGSDENLQLRALATGRHETVGRFHFSKKLAQRCFARGESILCCSVEEDDELKMAQSIADGAMASVLCVLIRTPRSRLGVLHLDRSYFQKPFTEDDLHLADALAAHVSAGIECAQLLRKSRDLFINTITALAQAVEMRDEYTGGHTARVTNYATLLGEQLQLSHRELELIRIGTPLHDIGKIGIDDAILRKPAKLTDEEFAIMQTHTSKGAAIIQTIPDLHPILPIVRSHHEWWNGTGYPDRLLGEGIPLLARIVSVCDAFDAMTSNRPYHLDRKARPPEVAFDELQRMSGTQFDPRCVEAFLAIRGPVLETMTASRVTMSLKSASAS